MVLSKLEPFAWIFMGGLILWGYQAATTKPASKAITTGSTAASSKAAVTIALSKGPRSTIWATPHGDVIEYLIPTSVMGVMVEYKRCFVFRDAVTRTSSMSCEMAPGNGDLSTPDGPDYSDLR
jgi:hypothetical protein